MNSKSAVNISQSDHTTATSGKVAAVFGPRDLPKIAADAAKTMNTAHTDSAAQELPLPFV
jgi:hypothetical protein